MTTRETRILAAIIVCIGSVYVLGVSLVYGLRPTDSKSPEIPAEGSCPVGTLPVTLYQGSSRDPGVGCIPGTLPTPQNPGGR